MIKTNEVPIKVKNKKKIEISKFEKLAKKVRMYLEEEERYLEKKSNEHINPSRLLSNS